MKITSGKYKYRKIEVPRGIRPTTEKVREAVFSMVAPWIPDAEVLDLFAGSGAMGLEALSRGATRCVFVEANRQNQKVLAANIGNCGAGEDSVIMGKDYLAALSALAESRKGLCFDIVIMDPPYEMTDYYVKALEMLQNEGLVDENSIIVCEHLYDNPLLDTYGKLKKTKSKKYGSIGVDTFNVL